MVNMIKMKNLVFPLFLLVIWVLPAVAAESAHPDFELVRETANPTIGRPVSVRVVAKRGFPASTSISWTVLSSGSPVDNADVEQDRPAVFTFTPTGEGRVQVLAEVLALEPAPRRLAGLSITVVFGEPPRESSGPVTLSLVRIADQPPRVGFMLDYGEGAPPASGMTEWSVSGNQVFAPQIDGTHKDIYSFVPGIPGDYTVTARLYGADRILIDEVSEVYRLGN